MYVKMLHHVLMQNCRFYIYVWLDIYIDGYWQKTKRPADTGRPMPHTDVHIEGK